MPYYNRNAWLQGISNAIQAIPEGFRQAQREKEERELRGYQIEQARAAAEDLRRRREVDSAEAENRRYFDMRQAELMQQTSGNQPEVARMLGEESAAMGRGGQASAYYQSQRELEARAAEQRSKDMTKGAAMAFQAMIGGSKQKAEEALNKIAGPGEQYEFLGKTPEGKFRVRLMSDPNADIGQQDQVLEWDGGDVQVMASDPSKIQDVMKNVRRQDFQDWKAKQDVAAKEKTLEEKKRHNIAAEEIGRLNASRRAAIGGSAGGSAILREIQARAKNLMATNPGISPADAENTAWEEKRKTKPTDVQERSALLKVAQMELKSLGDKAKLEMESTGKVSDQTQSQLEAARASLGEFRSKRPQKSTVQQARPQAKQQGNPPTIKDSQGRTNYLWPDGVYRPMSIEQYQKSRGKK